MKKETAQKLFLILLPVLAVGLATTQNSVSVLQPPMSIIIYGSYFDLIPEAGNCQILPPLAACLAVANVVLSIYHAVSGKYSVVKGCLWVSLLSACAASLPVVLDETVVVLPNVLLPIFMCIHAGLAYAMTKNLQENKANTGRRLEKQ